MLKGPELEALVNSMSGSALYMKLADLFPNKLKTAGEVFPTDIVPVIACSRLKERTVFPMAWGFTGREKGTVIANCRVETAKDLPLWRDAWLKHRCIVPASWYFEWAHPHDGGAERRGQKYRFCPKGERILNLAGVYRIEKRDGIPVPVFAVITREAPEGIRSIHDRMPLILPDSAASEWIMPDSDPEKSALQALVDIEYQKVV